MLPSHLQAALEACGLGVRSKLSSPACHILPRQDTPQLLGHIGLSTKIYPFSNLLGYMKPGTEASPAVALSELFHLISSLVPTKPPGLLLTTFSFSSG